MHFYTNVLSTKGSYVIRCCLTLHNPSIEFGAVQTVIHYIIGKATKNFWNVYINLQYPFSAVLSVHVLSTCQWLKNHAHKFTARW